jgi:hypothetical protein
MTENQEVFRKMHRSSNHTSSDQRSASKSSNSTIRNVAGHPPAGSHNMGWNGHAGDRCGHASPYRHYYDYYGGPHPNPNLWNHPHHYHHHPNNHYHAPEISQQFSTSYDDTIPIPPYSGYYERQEDPPYVPRFDDHYHHPSSRGEDELRKQTTTTAGQIPMTESISMSSLMMVTPTRSNTTTVKDNVRAKSGVSNAERTARSTSNRERRSSSRRNSNKDHVIIWDLHEFDVLCGRGAPTLYHIGNQAFRDLVQEHQTIYLCSKRSDKPAIAWEIYDIVTSRGGRFVKRNKARNRDGSSFAWEILTETQAYEKVCQSLREGAPALRARVFQDIQEQQRHGSLEEEEVDENKSTDSHKDTKDHDQDDNDYDDDKDKKPSPPRDLVADDKDQKVDVYAV